MQHGDLRRHIQLPVTGGDQVALVDRVVRQAILGDGRDGDAIDGERSREVQIV